MKKYLISLILLICFYSLHSSGMEIAVITGKQTPIYSIHPQDLKKIYLKIKKFINGTRIIPINLPPKSPLRKKFQENILDMDIEQLNIYWNKMYFHGIEPPLVLSSEKAVIKFVKKVKGAIGYIKFENVDNQVKILLVIKVE